MHLILASSSPQRKTLLAGLGIDFEVIPSGVDEAAHSQDDPAARAVELAVLKARDVAAKNSGAWVIGCDTLVEAPDGTLLEKPMDAADAMRMIRLQASGTSLVHSGVAIVSPEGKERSALSTSSVTFGPLTEEMMEWWIGTNLWQGRSGAFQIDGPGQLLIARIEGDWTGIVGLPVYLLGELWREAGFSLVG